MINQTTAYTYDALSRLSTAHTKDSAQTVINTYGSTYDKNGNRTRATTDGTGANVGRWTIERPPFHRAGAGSEGRPPPGSSNR